MSPLDIAVIVIVAAAFIAAVVAIIVRKVKRKGGCDCGCEGCPHCQSCGGKHKK